MILNGNGKGKLCYSSGKINKIDSVTIDGDTIQHGKFKVEIIDSGSDYLELVQNSFDGVSYILRRDNGLKRSSWYCRKYLR